MKIWNYLIVILLALILVNLLFISQKLSTTNFYLNNISFDTNSIDSGVTSMVNK